MVQYVARSYRNRPRRADEGDSDELEMAERDVRRTTIEVHEADERGVDTGLLDANGDMLYREPDVIAFGFQPPEKRKKRRVRFVRNDHLQS